MLVALSEGAQVRALRVEVLMAEKKRFQCDDCGMDVTGYPDKIDEIAARHQCQEAQKWADEDED